MKPDISAAYLYEVAKRSPIEAELWDCITEKQLQDWEKLWIAELLAGLQRLHKAGVPHQQWPQNKHWDWRKKAHALQGLLATPGFSVMCQGITQGLMFVDRAMHRCQIPLQAGKDLVYIEFLENAPWNRKELLIAAPRFRGVGSLLIRAAIQLSLDEGFKGRIGLHSLPQADNWYANTCGMTDIGIDSGKENLRYFEMTPEQAKAFIDKGI